MRHRSLVMHGSFGNARVFDDAWISSNADYVYAYGFGSKNRTITFYRNKDGGVSVQCGCFSNTLDAFSKKVKSTHGQSEFGIKYLLIADQMSTE